MNTMDRKIPNLQRRPPIWLYIFLFAGISACAYPITKDAHPISKDLLARIDKKKTYAEVMKSPEEHIGADVLWGGIIERVRLGGGKTILIVNQAPLNSHGYPQTGAMDGDFVAHTARALDPQVFREGRKVTMAGEIDRIDKGGAGSEEKTFPVVRIKEIHAWTSTPGRFQITKGWEFNQFNPPRESWPPQGSP
jgi:outer membrane lipoprotein